MRAGTVPTETDAWAVVGPGGRDRLDRGRRPVPAVAPDEVLLRVRACGVCRTDLHLADGDLPARAPRAVPGHEGVGEVVARGGAVRRFELGDRVGVPWLRRTCGRCRWCTSGAENLCPASLYTGWDADGCFATYAVVPAAFAYPIPDELTDVEAAPLLCAGIIGYRALRLAELPRGGRLGIYGFGASGHLTAQVARGQGAEVHVLTRDAGARELAVELGAASVGAAFDRPPVSLDAAILFAPAGELVPVALEALGPGGTLVIAGIHLTDIPTLSYARHLFRERQVRSVTANTRRDGEELFQVAAAVHVRARTVVYPFDHADQALDDMAEGRLTGAAVLTMPEP
ncbi:zinc-dependent alcohol dehydrogenase family protein [Cellulomonas sp. ICMP 17802]|uniref:zinc-dependent alcohol dehydrogenase family protein n=1 Tax=Cellulomonas sp. ICMP 17802 TaxID=3239199 RepID=UPI00351B0F6A